MLHGMLLDFRVFAAHRTDNKRGVGAADYY
jgi:hypothetical protein